VTLLEEPIKEVMRLRNYINGEWVEAEAKEFGDVWCPATGEKIAQAPFSTAAELDRAVQAAKNAYWEWRCTPPLSRARYFFRLKNLFEEAFEDIARVLVTEEGKTLDEARGEVRRMIENVEHATGVTTLMTGYNLEDIAQGIDCTAERQPIGVFGAIVPFNFPAMVPLWMIGSALACGNTVLLKPSEKDPSSAVFIAQVFAEAGLPAGVLNVVHGDKEAVDVLLEHPAVKAVSFVGSTPIAQSIYKRAADHGKRVQALGGAKNHMVVLPDADLNMAADAAVSAAYGSAGERCMAVSVLVAVGSIADDLVEAISTRMPALTIGPGTDPASQMGPLITAEHRDKVASYVAGAADEGATVVVDGREHEFDSNGFFIGVSLIDHVKPGMKVYDDEIFGPVLSVVRVETYADAVKLVNDNEFGNGVAIFTRDGGAARQFEFDVEAGMVGVNVPIPVPVGTFSFGGWKNSLFGDTHMYGPESIRFYTRGKVVTTRWPDPSTSVIDLGFPQVD